MRLTPDRITLKIALNACGADHAVPNLVMLETMLDQSDHRFLYIRLALHSDSLGETSLFKKEFQVVVQPFQVRLARPWPASPIADVSKPYSQSISRTYNGILANGPISMERA